MNASEIETWFTEEEVAKLSPLKRDMILELLSEIRANRRNWQSIQWLLRVILPEKFGSPMDDGSAAGTDDHLRRPAITISIEKAKELAEDHEHLIPRVRALLGPDNGESQEEAS